MIVKHSTNTSIIDRQTLLPYVTLPYVTLACRLLANESRMSSDPMELCSYISE